MMRRAARWLVIAALVIGYPVLAHYTNQSTESSGLGVAVALTPVVLMGLVLAWRSPQRWTMLVLLGLGCAAFWAAWPALLRHHGALYWLQHAGMQLILFVLFGRTLLAGREPLCTRFARIAHAPHALTPEHQRYARAVTLAWTVFFAAMAIVSTALFFLTPLTTWSFFANFVSFPLVILMFIVEYQVRRRVLPRLPPVSIMDGVRAFMKDGEEPRTQR